MERIKKNARVEKKSEEIDFPREEVDDKMLNLQVHYPAPIVTFSLDYFILPKYWKYRRTKHPSRGYAWRKEPRIHSTRKLREQIWQPLTGDSIRRLYFRSINSVLLKAVFKFG